MDPLLLIIIISGCICALLFLILCCVIAKVLCNPGSIGEIRSEKRQSQSESAGQRQRKRHHKASTEPESTPQFHQPHHHPPPPPVHDFTETTSVNTRRGSVGTRRGREKLKRPSRASKRRDQPPQGKSQGTPSPGNIVELGFGALNSSAKMHMDICEPNQSDLSFTERPSHRVTIDKPSKKR